VRIVLQGDFLQYQGDFLQTLGIVADERLADYPTIEEKRSEAQRLLRAHAWKSSVGDDFPLVVCLMGGTGTGKSTLFNSLAGKKISEVGMRRPCTLRAVLLIHRDFAPALNDCPFLDTANESEALVVEHQEPHCRHVLLVDTPDFDSVEQANRLIADNFFVLSDVMLFVTSQEKYGDLIGRQILERASKWGKRTLLLMNKTGSDAAYEDFLRGLNDSGVHASVIRVERLDQAPDLIPGLRERPEFSWIFTSEPECSRCQDIRAEEMVRLASNTSRGLRQLEEALQSETERVGSVNSRIDKILQSAAGEMGNRLDAVMSRDLEARIRERLQDLLRKYDFLFVPRMWVRNTLRKALLAVADVVVPGALDQAGITNEKDVRVEDLHETRSAAMLKPLEAAVATLNLRIAEMLAADPSARDLREVAGDSVSRWDTAKIHERYEKAFPGVERLLEAEFERIRDGLTTSDEIKLYGSYTLWALLLITAEIVVGGGFTLLDAILNTAVFPFIPKWMVNVKVLDVLKEIGGRVDKEHRGVLQGILKKQAELYKGAFAGLLPSEESLVELSGLREAMESVSTRFHKIR